MLADRYKIEGEKSPEPIALLSSILGGEQMYSVPRVTDFGRIELHTHAFPGSSNEVPDPTSEFAGGAGGGSGVGLIGLLGGALVLAGRGDSDQSEAVIPPEDEEEKLGQK